MLASPRRSVVSLLLFQCTGINLKSNSPCDSRARPVKLRSACNQCCAAKVKCSGEKTGCTRCRNTGADCIYQESRVGKVPGIRAKRRKDHGEKPARPQGKTVFTTTQTSVTATPTTESSLHSHDHNDTMSWVTDWRLDGPGTATLDLLEELDTTSNMNSVHTSTGEDSGSSGFMTNGSGDEAYIISSPDANLINLPMFQLATPVATGPGTDLPQSPRMPMTLGLRPRNEGDSQCCLECCQMINDLENYIMAELKAFKILLGIIRRALERLGALIDLQQDSRNLRCVMLFTTLMYQILELLEVCLSIVTAETTRQRSRSLAGVSFGIGFGDITMDAEEQSAFRMQTILREVQQAAEVLVKLRALATGGSDRNASGAQQGVVAQGDHYLDLELRFKDLAARFRGSSWTCED
ncbi:hypothetical protein F4802DRAFT_422397 [Xylaria palmicola]|nr:hypothetical protein F4802DRAFT_422397 [Xylaria palmicola]